jgi:hypothetical protein
MDPDFTKLMHAKGEAVVDCDGDRIGTMSQVACEPTTSRAGWLVVRTAVLRRARLVPVEGATDAGGTIRVPFSKASVLRSPKPTLPVAPAIDECTALEEYYRRAA